MKTAVITERFPTIPETFVGRHAQYLKATVICRSEDLLLKGCYGAIRVLAPSQPYRISPLLRLPGLYRARRFLYDLACPRKYYAWDRVMERFWRTYLEEERPDVVLAEFAPNALRCLPACRRCGIPLVAHFHGYDASTLLRHGSYRRAVRDVFRHAAAVVCVSRFMQANLIKAGCPEHKLHTIPCGADVDQFCPSARVGEQPCRFVALSRLDYVKGPLVTLEAFRRVHDVRPTVTLDWIGTGPLQGQAEEFIRQHHLEGAVRLHGAVRHSEVRPILERSSVLVQASLTTPDGAVEGWGISIAEGLATALPAVVSRSGGMMELVLDGHNGFLFEEGDSGAMASAMRRLADDPDLRVEMGRRGRRHVEEVGNAKRNLEILEAVLQGVCGARPSADPTVTASLEC